MRVATGQTRSSSPCYWLNMEPSLRVPHPVFAFVPRVCDTAGSMAATTEDSLASREAQAAIDHPHARVLRTSRMNSSSSSSSSNGASSVAVGVVPSSCTWTQRSVDGQCVLAPRSCYDCLNTLPSTGETCTLTPDGVCMGAAAYDASRDYRRPGQSTAYPPRLNFFTADNATYCESNDKVCASCRAKTFQSWKTYASQYCEGQDGCICVAVCEMGQWEATIHTKLEDTLRQEQTANGTFLNCTVEPLADDSVASSSSDTAVDFVGISLTNKDILASDDECMWYQSQTYCGAPRTCFDCLNTPLYSGNKCMLHSSGYCTSMAAFDYQKYYTRSNTSYTALFPSTNTTYCSSDDSACKACRASTAFAQWTDVSSPAAFCVGPNGCVCVASCESAQWKSSIVNLTCNTSAVDQAAAASAKPRYQLSDSQIIIYTALSCLLSMVVAFSLLWLYRRHIERHSQRPRPTRSPKGPVLELSGWKAMREKLIETEREFVGDAGEEPASHGLERRLHLRNGEGEGDATTEAAAEPPMIVVEEGDAYRPVSPSRMHV